MSNSPPTPSNCTESFLGLLNCSSGLAAQSDTLTIGALVAALAISFASLGAQTLGFVILRLRLFRIYRPRSYLVAEKERVPTPPGGLIGWLYPLFTTTNLTIIQKCGLDAYFFLRYLRMLLKIFFPMALILLPILLPINATAGGGYSNLDQLSISNVVASKDPSIPGSRLWAHLVLAVLSILYILYILTHELREYIRVRQAFLSSPQHRIRASATTVLVTGIPQKWLTHAALSGLYDVFPGGLRNIWINRNYDALATKVNRRVKIAKKLENAETNLVKLCRKAHLKAKKKQVQDKSRTKQQKKQDRVDEDKAAEEMAQGGGVSTGAQQPSRSEVEKIAGESEQQRRATKNPLHVVGHGFGVFGKGISKAGGRVVGNLDSSVKKTNNAFNHVTDAANNAPLGGGFAADDSLYELSPNLSGGSPQPPHQNALRLELPQDRQANETATEGVAAKSNESGLSYDGLSNPSGASASSRGVMQSSPHVGDDYTPVSPHNQSFSQEPLRDDVRSETRDGDDNRTPSSQTIRSSKDDKLPISPMQIEEPEGFKQHSRVLWTFLRDKDTSIVLPSPQPHTEEEEEFPLYPHADLVPKTTKHDQISKSKFLEMLQIWKKKDNGAMQTKYPDAINVDLDEDKTGNPRWRDYLEAKDRETMRLPLLGFPWFPSIPFVGKKVDRVYYLRRELARLNLEIEFDQKNPERFPLMNSAFIQFNHQIAAHMCCQSLSHHIPQQMAPRIVEISPTDVIWDNMSVKWWERFLRIGVTSAIIIAMIGLYVIPVAITGLLSNISNLTKFVPFLGWLNRAPRVIIDIIQGILPAVLLNLILWLIPTLFGFLIRLQGVPTGSAKEQGLQAWYFTFLFIQVFFVVSISSGLTTFFSSIAEDPTSIVRTLAKDLPQSANYFYSYLTIQSLSTSASALLQVGSLISWFLLAPLLDSTARAKWKRQTSLSSIDWGTFFPMFTNFAAIGIIYSILAPLILVFMLLIFGLFWIVYRYNVLFVNSFRNDTGGLLFPTAINQLFVGLYFLELCMIGIFFTSTVDGKVVCIGQGVIMSVMLAITIFYQWGINMSFRPLFKYIPITLEDEAVIRDEIFAKEQASKFAPLSTTADVERDGADDKQGLARNGSAPNEAVSHNQTMDGQSDDPSKLNSGPQHRGFLPFTSSRPWHARSESKLASATDNLMRVGPEAFARLRYVVDGKPIRVPAADGRDPEAQMTVGDLLYSGLADELEDLSPADRDLLVRYSFQHSALRARRPVVWIPRDRLGVSDDEILRAKELSTVNVAPEEDGAASESKTYIAMSNEGTALDHKGHVVFRSNPPDFSAVDLVSL